MLRLACVGFSMAFFTLASPCFAGSIAKIVAVAGTPTSSGPGGNRALSSGSELFEHDTITVSSGNAQMLFLDGTKLVVGPGSKLVIEKYLMRGPSTAQNFSINALRGTYRFITGQSAKGAYKIKTANATIGIRGTGFDFWVESKTGVAVLEGKVKLCNSNKKCVDLNAGCELGVSESGRSQKIFGEIKAQLLISKLPYIINQSQLRKPFRLPIATCNKIFDLYSRSDKQGQRSEVKPLTNPTPTPVPAPTPIPTPPTPPTPTIPTRPISPNGG